MSDTTSSLRIPVSVLTGFLGSGKTTLLSSLIRHPGLENTACVINEFGEVGLDAELVERSSEDVVMMDSGCLCCSIRGDLVNTLRTLFLKRVRGDVPEFERVVIETTGLADPAPILHTIMSDPLISSRFRLDGVITTVDAVNGMGVLDRQEESVKQAAIADRIVLTKTDLADEAGLAALKERLKALNPGASIMAADHGNIDPADILNAGLFNPETKRPEVQAWLREEAYQQADADHVHGHDHDHGDGGDHGHGHHQHDVNRHDARIRAFCVTTDSEINWDDFVSFAELLIGERGEDVLRMKGILKIQGTDRPVAVHGVQHIFHPPTELEAWPSDDRRSRLVFITRDIRPETILAMFRESTRIEAKPVSMPTP